MISVLCLPPELTDQVIDHLHDNKAALLACSLAARVFTSSAQYHLFRSVTLVLTYTSARAAEFLTLLQGSPRIASFVRELNIEERSAQPGLPIESLLPVTAQILHRLETLRLSWMNFHKESVHDAFVSQLQYLANIRNVSVASSSFNTFENFTEFLAACPSMEELELSNVSWNKSAVESIVAPRPVIALKKLVWIEVTCATHLIHWMFTCAPRKLDTVGNLSTTAEEASVMTHLLHDLGSNLHHLQLGITNSHVTMHTSGILKALSVVSNTSLRALCFDLSLKPGRHASHSVTWVLATLSQATSRTLERVTFRMKCHAVEGLPEVLHFESIDELLSTRSVFECLSVVEFVHSYVGNATWVSKDRARENLCIREKMKRLDKRRILKFV